MTPLRCDRLWQIDAYRDGRLGPKDAESLERHLRGCAECSAQMKSDDQLRTLALALHSTEPNDFALHRLRARVLRDAASGVPPSSRAPWRTGAVVALGAACALVLGVVVHRTRPDTPRLATPTTQSEAAPPAAEPQAPAPETLAATVVGETDAHFSQTREQRREQVDLQEGTVHVHVRPQDAGERFLVLMPDGEIEVRGTRFDVTVRGGETIRVFVESGVVELRLKARAALRLGDGDTWTVPPVVAARPPRAPASAGPLAAPAASADVGDGVSSYAAAMKDLRDGRYEEAAAAFHAYVLAWPRSSQAEDASFLEAVALARAGRPDAAGLAAERHLESFPLSFHTREATTLVERAAALRRPQNP